MTPMRFKSSGTLASRMGLFSQRFYRAAITLALALAGVILVVLLAGDHASARVRQFSWNEHQIGVEDSAFVITFSRPMNTASVETNLTIDPPLSGRISWAGRRMAYTLDVPAAYGRAYTVRLDEAQDLTTRGNPLQPFLAQFRTRDRAFAYIGDSGEEQNRLVLYNLTRDHRDILTPPDWVVMDFKPYPLGDRILFSAMTTTEAAGNPLDQRLYAVTTGITPNPPREVFGRLGDVPDAHPGPAGEITPILDSQDYQNLGFDISADGHTLVVQRVNRQDPSDFGPWVLRDGEEPRPLAAEPGGDFLIAPDSQSIVLLQGQGTAILPLTPPEDDPNAAGESGGSVVQPLDFLADYGRVFDMSRDGTSAAMVNYNQNNPDERFTQSLFFVTNQGEEKELLRTDGSFLAAQFDPTNRLLYCLVTALDDSSEAYLEQPFLTAVNVRDGTVWDLLALPPQASLNMSLAPDGLALLLDQQTRLGSTNPDLDDFAELPSQMWLLPLFSNREDRLAGIPSPADPEPLPMTGAQPIWLP